MPPPVTQSVQRHKRGRLDTAAVPAASGIQINVGDLVVFHSGLAFPVSNPGVAWNSGSVVQNYSGARADFAGVSLSQANSTVVIPQTVTLALDGIFQYPLPAATSGSPVVPGTFVSLTQGTVSGYFHPQQLETSVSGQAVGIGKVVDLTTPVASGNADVTVWLQSVIAKGTIPNT